MLELLQFHMMNSANYLIVSESAVGNFSHAAKQTLKSFSGFREDKMKEAAARNKGHGQIKTTTKVSNFKFLGCKVKMCPKGDFNILRLVS